MEELLALILDTEAENEGDIDAVIAEYELPEDTSAAMRGVFRLMNAYRDNLTPEIVTSLVTKAGYMTTEEPVEGEPVEQNESDDHESEIFKADGTLDLSNVPEAVRPALERLWRERSDAEEEKAELQKALETQRIEKRRSEFVTKAADLGLPGQPADLAELMMKVEDVDPDLYIQMDTFLKSISEVVKNSEIFKESGHQGDEDVAGDAYSVARKRAQKLMAEAEGKLSEADAIDTVFKQDRELAARHAAETRRS